MPSDSNTHEKKTIYLEDPRGAEQAVAAKTFAAIDLGTNSCRLLVVQSAPSGFDVIDAFSRIVRLGEGLSRSGRLSQTAMTRAISALRVCARKIRAHGCVIARGVTTAACRAAENSQEFLSLITQETGLTIEMISSEEEAKLSLLGCAPLLDHTKKRALVFDIGGGSTEVMWVETNLQEPKIIDWLSLPVGVVTFSEFSEEQRRATLEHVYHKLSVFGQIHAIDDYIESNTIQLIGSSSTVATLAALHLQLPRYDRSIVDGYDMDQHSLRGALDYLYAMTPEERIEHPCVGSGRADLIHAGARIFECIHQIFPSQSVRVADRGVREGILAQLMKDHLAQQLAPNRIHDRSILNRQTA